MVVNHPKVRRVLVVEHRDEAGVLLHEAASPVLHPRRADLAQSSGKAFEPSEAVQLQASINRLQASRQPERRGTVQRRLRSASAGGAVRRDWG